jgi:hypothetical protein
MPPTEAARNSLSCLEDGELLRVVDGKLHFEICVDRVDDGPHALVDVVNGDAVGDEEVLRVAACEVAQPDGELHLHWHDLALGVFRLHSVAVFKVFLEEAKELVEGGVGEPVPTLELRLGEPRHVGAAPTRTSPASPSSRPTLSTVSRPRAAAHERC